jgi:hypothetical protein
MCGAGGELRIHTAGAPRWSLRAGLRPWREAVPSDPLDDVNAAIEQVLDGTAPAPRLVFRMQPAAIAATNRRALAARVS